ncbi:LPS export ABC transporter periplasmic protein LptC [Candidatus Magnetominusculus dajiuhuensis]|uniref:LPS export ABC transporter periplasmic protein LptC n=1 Tax=Candidatus Magnetominusculus dajiuhuensis TaxID=3137712 RepID=UPI003B42FF7B
MLFEKIRRFVIQWVMRKFIPIVLIIAATVLFVYYTSQEIYSLKKISIVPGNSYLENVKITHADMAAVKWTAAIEKIAIIKTGETAELTNIQFNVPEKEVTLKAGKGTYDIKHNAIDIIGEVTAYNKEFQVKSKDIKWDFKAETLKSANEVVLTGKNVRVRADSIETFGGEQLQLTGNVKVVYR